jgi:hypothetical protein
VTQVDPRNPFVADTGVNKPGIVGARWWNHGLQASSSLRGRRAALWGCLVAGGGILALGTVTVWGIASIASSGDDEREELRKALDMQRDYGWNFGTANEGVTYDALQQPYDRAKLKTLVGDMSPTSPALMPFYQPTLFQSPEALPNLALPRGAPPVTPIAEALVPISTALMDIAAAVGGAVSGLLARADAPVALVVDLKGAEAVSFAKGASSQFDPVFLFDNWPHPKGVVKAHLPLAAAVFEQPVIAAARTYGRPRWPMFVLDRDRLSPYTDDATQFDNRWIAKMPDASVLERLGVKRVLYVVPLHSDLPELEDLNDVFVSYAAKGIEVRAVALSAFVQADTMGTPRYYGSSHHHQGFFSHYPWKPAPRDAAPPESVAMAAREYTPKHRPKTIVKTPVSPSGTGETSGQGTDGPSIGMTPVIVAVGTGLLLGSKLNRSGSWNRSSGGSGG